MAVEFGPLAAVDTEAELNASMRVSARLSAIPLATDEAFILARIPVRMNGEGEEADDAGPVIVVPTTTAAAMGVGGSMAAALDVTAQLSGSMQVGGRMFGGAVTAGDTPAYLLGAPELRPRFAEIPPAEAFGFYVAQPPIMTVTAGLSYERLIETVIPEITLDNLPLISLRERAGFLWGGLTALDSLAAINDAVSFHDAMAVVLRELVNDGFDFDAALTDNYTAISRVMDALRVAGLAATQLDAYNTVIAAIAFQVLVDMFAKEQITDAVAFNAASAQVLIAIAQLVDQIIMEATEANTLSMGVVLHESVALAAEAGGALEAHAAVREAIALSLRLNLDNQNYVAYVLNTDSKQLTSYDNYPFNSLIAFERGDQYGMTPDGIRRLGGGTDDGDPIRAQFRLAFTNLGSSALKRMQAAYLGISATGDMRVKVYVNNRQTRKRDVYYYRLVSLPSDGPEPARVQIGQGLRTVYWGFGVENIDGAAFEIDLLQLLPIVLEQHMDGQSGGKW